MSVIINTTSFCREKGDGAILLDCHLPSATCYPLVTTTKSGYRGLRVVLGIPNYNI